MTIADLIRLSEIDSQYKELAKQKRVLGEIYKDSSLKINEDDGAFFIIPSDEIIKVSFKIKWIKKV